MACTVQPPLFLSDLTQSQYLWPLPSTNLDELAADAHLRNEYKHQVQAKLAFSDANVFRKQFLLFAEQFLYELKRSQEQEYDFGWLQLPTPTPFEPVASGEDAARRHATAPAAPKHLIAPPKPKTKSKSPKPRLEDPKPRLTSLLSPKPCGTLLPSHSPRRPMPCKRHRDTPLLKQLLQKTIEPEYRAAVSGGGKMGDSAYHRRLDPAYDGLASSWVVVPPPDVDWEMVADASIGMDTMPV
ncbi:hypothetical protein M422DRAFT_244798 [Sphaerobolus stellatus SS14]|nr:hypothetical protein M422DRAFT_244798 [Sphaerobolus stellatus SS14]